MMDVRRIVIVMASLSLALAAPAVTLAHDVTIVRIDNIVAHAPGVGFKVWDDQGINQLLAPQVPDQPATYSLDDIGSCPDRYTPVVAWSDAHTSWPSHDAMYSVRAEVTEDGEIQLAVRSRQNIRGYSYIDVYVLCKHDV